MICPRMGVAARPTDDYRSYQINRLMLTCNYCKLFHKTISLSYTERSFYRLIRKFQYDFALKGFLVSTKSGNLL